MTPEYINIRSEYTHKTAIINCMIQTKYNSAKLLLLYGADPYISDDNGHDCYWYAKDDIILINILDKYGPNISLIKGTSPIDE
jgi:ankyrin repeat protein